MTPSRPDTVAPALEDIAKGALAGLVAGLVASFAMDQFQALVSKLSSGDDAGDSGEEPTTVKAADRISTFVTGEPLADDSKKAAGDVVHYALGGMLGLAYGVAAEFRPIVTAAMGTGLSLSTFALLDEAAVPAAGLAPPPTEMPATSHLYAAASHLVFGGVTEGVRRGLRAAMRAS